MTASQTRAWILLSVPETPDTREAIVAAADYINHAIPTPDELQTSLDWLQAHGLIRSDGTHFCTTEAGTQLLARIRATHRSLMKQWDALAAELE